MTDTTPTPDEPLPPPVPPTEEAQSSGPAGWPGEVVASATNQPEKPQPAQEVDAVPLSKRETRGPSIRVEAERREPAREAHAGPDTPSPPPPAGAQAAASQAHAPTRAWAVLMHLAYLIPFNIPGLVVTALIWVYSRRDDPFSDDQAKEAINFQVFYACVGFLLTVTCFLSPLYFVLWLIGAVLSIVAAVNAGDGKRYRYPYIFRLIT